MKWSKKRKESLTQSQAQGKKKWEREDSDMSVGGKRGVELWRCKQLKMGIIAKQVKHAWIK